MRTLALFALCAHAVASAAPVDIGHQGRLLDAAGTPISGEHTLVFALYSQQSDSAATWQQSTSLTLSDGYFSVLLSGIDSEGLAGQPWLGITQQGTELLPRVALSAVPYALRAASVETVTLGPIDEPCTAETTALHGTLRFVDDSFEGCTTGGWAPLGQPNSATGGDSVVEHDGYRIHTFTRSGTLYNTGGPLEITALVVAGGGGGGGRSGGGGGAGGLLVDTLRLNVGESLAVVVGAGGRGGSGDNTGTQGADGGTSSVGPLVAVGGGGGGSDSGSSSPPEQGRSGGSGGGGRYGHVGGSGVVPQGFPGGYGTNLPYAGGGGGGAGGPGVAGTPAGEVGDGGPGRVVDLSGDARCYAGGGGGGAHNPANGRGYATSVQGLPCGGGVGGQVGGGGGAAGLPNTGGGGGAGSTSTGAGGSGGSGGSGVIILRYPM